MKRNECFILILLILAILSGCTKQDADMPTESAQERFDVISTITQENCWLCSDRTDTQLSTYWDQNNIGIVSLNTFEVMPVIINRYNVDGTLLEEQTGVLTSRSYISQDSGFLSHSMEDVDRGYASGSVYFNEDDILDAEKTATFLCQSCLDNLLSKIHKNEYGVGVINFETRELRAFEKNIVGFGLGDFYIDCDFNDTEKRESAPDLNFLIFYAPLRYTS